MPSTRSEKDNYNCISEIINVAVCDGLREIFKQEWDKHYGATKGVWDDTPKSGNELYNMEILRKHAKPYVNAYQTGERSDWDFSALTDSILYSNAIKKHLAPHVSHEVNELRKLRNKLTHEFGSKHKISDVDFEKAYKKVKKFFKVLKLSTANVEKILNDSKGKHLTRSRKITYISLIILIFGVSYYWFTNTFETKSPFFRVLPTRPVHLVANRSRTVNAILEELRDLSIRNNRSLTYLYISGNPGSGKSQLARLVGQRYGANISNGWIGSTTFVMTLNGRSLHDILESYVDFARRLNCNENTIASIRNSNETMTGTKNKNLRTEIAIALGNLKHKCTWLLIVDNVVKLREISSFLPQLEDEDWQGGQVLITTQDMSSVPSNSSMTVHISVSQGMDLAQSCDFLTDLSELVENQDLVGKVAKELDYQPLALASAAFYVKQLRETKASPQFTWKDYLKKLDEGKRNLIEMRLSEANEPAYSLTMSIAVLLAVKTFAENDPALKQAFTFFSYVSNEAQSLQVVVRYVLRVNKELDKEDVGLRILQCSLILTSNGQKVVSISLHHVVHDSIKLYIANGMKNSTKSRVPLDVFKLLLWNKCALGEIALIPHLKSFHGRTNNLSLTIIVPGSVKLKNPRTMQEHIFNLTTVLIRHGEFLLSKNYLILALKLSTGGRDKVYPKESSHVSFPKIGDIYNHLGAVEIYLGDTQQARKYLTEALKHYFSRQHRPSHDESVSTCLINLASLPCSNRKECNENLKYSELALQIDDRLETKGIYYINLGNKHSDEGDLRKAEEYYLLAFEIFKEILRHVGDNDPKLCFTVMCFAQLWSNLGAVNSRSGNYEQSKIYLTKSIKMYGKVTGPNHLALAYTYHNLGIVHFKLNELPQAEDCFRRALKIYSQHLEPSHERIRSISKVLAGVLEETGQLNEAAELGKQHGTCRCNV